MSLIIRGTLDNQMQFPLFCCITFAYVPSILPTSSRATDLGDATFLPRRPALPSVNEGECLLNGKSSVKEDTCQVPLRFPWMGYLRYGKNTTMENTQTHTNTNEIKDSQRWSHIWSGMFHPEKGILSQWWLGSLRDWFTSLKKMHSSPIMWKYDLFGK